MPYCFVTRFTLIGLAMLHVTVLFGCSNQEAFSAIDNAKCQKLGFNPGTSTTICVFRRCSSNAPLRLARPNHFQTKPQQFPHLVLTDSADQFRRARKATNAEAIAATIAPAAMMREANAIEVAFLAWDAAANAASLALVAASICIVVNFN